MNQSFSTGISKLAYNLPDHCLTIKELDKAGLTNLSAETLEGFGFSTCYISRSNDEIVDLLIKSAQEVLIDVGKKIKNDDVEAVIFYSALSHSEYYAKSNSLLDLFSYNSMRILYELGMDSLPSFTLAQKGCSGVFQSLELADRLLQTSEKKYVLCLCADRLPTDGNREIIYNTMSDAAGAMLIGKDEKDHSLLSSYEQSNLAYWNTSILENEILAMYFPMAQRTVQNALENAGMTIDDIDWIIPHNVSVRSWDILVGLLGVSPSKVWTENVARTGHTVSCDHIINISDMERDGTLKKGDILLWFTFGFGTHWSVMISRY